MRFQSYGVSLVALLLLVASGCSQLPGFGASAAASPPAGAGSRAVTVSAQPATTGPIAMKLTYSGSVQPITQVSVVPQISGRIQKLNVDLGSTVKAGDLLASLDRATLEDAVNQAQANLAVAKAHLATLQAGARPENVALAEAALAGAQAKMKQAQQPYTSADIQAADSAVTSAESALQTVQTNLQKLQQMPTPDDVKTAEIALEKAKDALNQANASREGACAPRSPKYVCTAGEAAVYTAITAVNDVQHNLDVVKAGAKPEDIAAAQKAVEGAQAQLASARAKAALVHAGATPEDIAIAQAAVDQAQNQLALAKSPYTAQDLQAAQAQVDQVQAALDSANSQLAEADVLAPFDGIVVQKSLDAGALASTQSPIVVLASQAVEVTATVEEANVGYIKPGQSVSLAVATYPGQPITAKVASIAPSADAKTHTFLVTIVPDKQDGLLKSGMYADVQITAKQQPKAVLVPQQAVVARSGSAVVFVVSNGKAVMRQVETGLTDGQNVEIISGVQAGESVVTAGTASLNDGDAVRLAGVPGQGGQSTSGGRSGTPGPNAAPGANGTPGRGPGRTGTPRAGGATTPTPAQ